MIYRRLKPKALDEIIQKNEVWNDEGASNLDPLRSWKCCFILMVEPLGITATTPYSNKLINSPSLKCASPASARSDSVSARLRFCNERIFSSTVFRVISL